MKGIIFGAGQVGRRVRYGLEKYYNVDVVAFADTYKSGGGIRRFANIASYRN